MDRPARPRPHVTHGRALAVCLALLGCTDAPDAPVVPGDGSPTPTVDATTDLPTLDTPAAPDVPAAPLDVRSDAAPDLTRDASPDGVSARPDATTDAVAIDRPSATDRPTPTDAAPSPRPIWVTAYYAGWMQDAVPPAAVDLPSVSQIQHFCAVPRQDGTLDVAMNGLTAAHSRAAVAAAHAAGKRALVSIGGADTVAGFRGAWSTAHRASFVTAIVELMQRYGYDGIDLDVEPLATSDAASFQALVRELHAAMIAARPDAILTAAAGEAPGDYTPVQSLFTQINLMTYDMSGPWEGWVTWHNTALHNGGATFPSTGGPLPTVESMVRAYVAVGIDRSRLGIGIDFYGYDWRGATAPRQPIGGVTVTSDSYAALMDRYGARATMGWDVSAMVPYLSVDAAGSADDHFVSYDDPRSIQAKIDFVRAEGLGGVILWELGGGYRASQPAGARDVLLRAVGHAAFGR